jgi:hypothetical protein
MSKTVKKNMVINSEVPQDVKDRVKANLKDRAIDCSDIPELTDWLAPPVIIKVSFDEETARSLRDKATARHQTPAQTVDEMVRKELKIETV